MKKIYVFALLSAFVAVGKLQAQCSANISYQQTSGSVITFTADSLVFGGFLGYDSNATYTWSFGDGTGGGGVTVTHQFASANGVVMPYVVCLTILDGNRNCNFTVCDTVYVQPDSTGTCYTSILYNNLDSLYTFSTSNTGVAPFTYSWVVNGQNAGAGDSLSLVVIDSLAGSSTQVCVTVTDSTGCVSSNCVVISNPANGNCNAYITYTNIDSAYTFTAWSTGIAPAVFEWSYNNTLIDSSFDSISTITLVLDSANFINGNVVCVTITDANGCVSSNCIAVNDSSAGGACSAFFVIYADSLNNFGGDTSATYYGYNYSTGNYGANILWDFGDGTTSTDPYPSHTYAQPGTYVVCLTVGVAGTSCYSTYCDSSFYVSRAMLLMKQLTIVGPTQINNLKEAGISVYPNPASNELIISSAVAIEYEKIFNMEGQQLYGAKSVNNKIDVSKLSSGVYILELTSGNQVLRTRFIKD
jgi:hypothetical protein